MQEVSGSIGPALLLRSVFAELNRHTKSKALSLSPRLQGRRICRISGKKSTPGCPNMIEWVRSDMNDEQSCALHTLDSSATSEGLEVYTAPSIEPHFLQTTASLQVATDPRIPDELEFLSFILPNNIIPLRVEWLIDEKIAAVTSNGQRHFLWRLERGQHTAYARIWTADTDEPLQTETVSFFVM